MQIIHVVLVNMVYINFNSSLKYTCLTHILIWLWSYDPLNVSKKCRKNWAYLVWFILNIHHWVWVTEYGNLEILFEGSYFMFMYNCWGILNALLALNQREKKGVLCLLSLGDRHLYYLLENLNSTKVFGGCTLIQI